MTEQTTRVSYAPGGGWTLLVRGSTVLLVAASPSDPVVPELWHLLGETSNLGTVRSATAPALDDRPYSLLTIAHDSVTASSRGMDVAAGDRLLADAAVVPAGTSVTIGETFGTLWLPLESGVVAAGAATVTWTSQPRPAIVAPEPEPEPDPEPDPEPEPEPAPEPEPEPDPEPERLVEDVTRLRPAPPEPEEPSPPAPTRGVLVLESGQEVPLEGRAVLGRAPRVPDWATEDVLLVNLAEHGRDVSRQHAEIFFEGHDAFVRDLGSSNGTKLLDPSGRITDLAPGVPELLRPRSVVIIAEVTPVTYRLRD